MLVGFEKRNRGVWRGCGRDKGAHFKEVMKLARWNVSDRDILKYDIFSQQLKQSQGLGSGLPSDEKNVC